MFASNAGDGGPSGWEWPSPPPVPRKAPPAIETLRSLVGNSGGLAGLPACVVPALAAGLAGAAAAMALRLFLPAVAAGLPSIFGPLPVGGIVFGLVLALLVASGGGGRR